MLQELVNINNLVLQKKQDGLTKEELIKIRRMLKQCVNLLNKGEEEDYIKQLIKKSCELNNSQFSDFKSGSRIGESIKSRSMVCRILKEKKYRPKQIAEIIGCHRTNVYNYFRNFESFMLSFDDFKQNFKKLKKSL